MEYPATFQNSILKRAFSEKEFESIVQSYHNAKLRHTYRVPSDQMFKLAESAKKIGTIDTAKRYKVSKNTVDYAITRVARHQFWNGKK